MLGSGLRSEAAEFYSDAHRKLMAFRNAYPDWNQRVIRFRLKYLGEKLADLPPVDATPVAPATDLSSPTETSRPVDPSEQTRILEGQLAASNEHLRQIMDDNSLLLSKLREAMSARPADIDPAEVRKAEAKILELEKENEIIKFHLQKALAMNAEREQQADQSERIEQLQHENRILKESVARLTEDSGKIVASVDSLNEQIKTLSKERDSLRRQLQEDQTASDETAVAQLRAENKALAEKSKSTIGELERALASLEGTASKIVALEKERDQLRQRLAATASGDQRDVIEELMRENAVLKRAAREASPASDLNDAAMKAKIEALEKDKRKLQAQMAKARRAESGGRRSWLPRIGRRDSRDVTLLEARLAVFEAEKDPYNAEELALLKSADFEATAVPETTITASDKTGVPKISQAAAQLEAAAQAAARDNRFAEAEAKFNEILDLIPNHAPTLASLALTQLKQQKIGEAEANLEMALKVEPENSYALFLTGLLRMSQDRYDDAVTFLSRATVLDPDDAEAQNHLGVALTEVGHRSPAEAALRKAIRLRPGYADAHINLAVVYASQDPPFKELAKYHYQRAINAGHLSNPRIENLLRRD